jgi:hypothetical protein
VTEGGGDAARRAILARRAQFVAAAVVGIACGKTTATPPADGAAPGPCLSVYSPRIRTPGRRRSPA